MTDLPDEFKNQMQAQLGPDFEDFMKSLKLPSPVSIRYNTQKYQPATGMPVPWCSTGRYLDQRPSFTREPLFHAGAYYVQEASSMLLEQALIQTTDLSRPLTVLDLCAAPGGKSTHLLSLLSPESLLISNEVIRSRTNILASNLDRWGRPNVIVTQNDPADFESIDSFFDVVVVDAPCSGEGLFRKEPEAMEEWSVKNVDLCASRQRRIVSDVWKSLKPGGILIYSTCTYNTRENQQNLAWIKSQHDCTFEQIRLDPSWGALASHNNDCIGYQCLPHRVRGEGFFFSIIRKNGESRTHAHRSRNRLQTPAPAEASLVKKWITNPETFFFFLHGSRIRILPAGHEALFPFVLENLHVIQAGTCLGEVKKNKIVPDHALALSIHRNREELPGITVTTPEAMTYLRMDSLRFENQSAGFRVIEFEGLGLGWVNVLPGRVNSLFPAAQRVRLAD